jgi:hypothetical protein
MKKLFLIVPFLAAVLFSCKTSQIVSYNDDIYSSPSEEKRLARVAAEERAKKEAEEKQKENDARLAQKAKDDANPYYQDPSFNQDDYYDYQYASRINRFGNPIMGAGYYDNYYTNSYYYNGNPNCYGTSIYSSYNYLMPSYQFGNYYNGLNIGIGYSWGNGWYSNNPYYNPYYNPYNPYNPWCGSSAYWSGYQQGYYNGLYGYPYYASPYAGGWNNGGGWGYFNSYDVNSNYSTYAPRGSNGGGNSPRNTSAGMAVPEGLGERAKFISTIAQKQESTPRFTEVPRPKASYNDGSPSTISGNSGSPVRGSNGNNTSVDNSNPGLNSPNTGPVKGGSWPANNSSNTGSIGNNGSPTKENNTVNPPRTRTRAERISNSNVDMQDNTPTSTNKSAGNSGWNSNTNNGGNWNSGSSNSGSNNSNNNSSPRGGSSGSSNRPR